MPSVCFYFEVHQPCRLRPYSFFDIGSSDRYDDEELDRLVMKKVAEKCYQPMNALLLDLIRKHEGRFRFTFSLTGTFIDQMLAYSPETLTGFQALAETGCVEFLDETDSHSLAAVFSEEEFRSQVLTHRERMQELFGCSPRAFRNTELIYCDRLAKIVEDMGYSTILAEGVDRILDWRSPRFIYTPAGCDSIRLFLKSYSLSDDIAFRFSNRSWSEWPLMADTYAGWLKQTKSCGNAVGLFMDYETFGEHQWKDTGIFEFMKALPGMVLDDPDMDFLTVSEAADRYGASGELSVPDWISWADAERDLSAWLGNEMQRDALNSLYACRPLVIAVNDPQITRKWRRLQTSDHFYYMSTKKASDGEVHEYFTPYGSPYSAYTNFMNILADFRLRLSERITLEA
ncbi:MAG: glycoside hydrolase family 57 protein [Clostridia bacterium]|nr:glycoside hydrolase family 57 protein [Clostridia bacterium]